MCTNLTETKKLFLSCDLWKKQLDVVDASQCIVQAALSQE